MYVQRAIAMPEVEVSTLRTYNTWRDTQKRVKAFEGLSIVLHLQGVQVNNSRNKAPTTTTSKLRVARVFIYFLNFFLKV